MGRISILDCTLRDGGYVNDFRFGMENMKNIVTLLTTAGLEIVECGFLVSGKEDADTSLFGSVEKVRDIIGSNKETDTMFVAMIQYGKISGEEIAPCDGRSIDGIRVTFHEHEIEPAFVLGKELMDKGYKVFMQPVGTVTYTDQALLNLIDRVNQLHPYAFYIVDTLGTMYKNDLLRMFYLVDHNLNKNISVGFHSHNNLQLSFANAQEIMQLNSPRKLIIDTAVYGMGRGAGNLCTELVTQYINYNFELRYDNIAILQIIDEYIKPLSMQYKWGYDAAFYLASVLKCHPNYASFLMNKQTLHVQDIHAILNSMDEEKRPLYDERYANQKYIQYMSHSIDDSVSLTKISEEIRGKEILLLAPGKTLKTAGEKIKKYLEQTDCYKIAINFVPEFLDVDMIFVSNIKRYKNIQKAATKDTRIVMTSNINQEKETGIWSINYSSYLNEQYCVIDNSGLMCMNMLKKAGAEKIVLAGFDGFQSVEQNNFFSASLYQSVDDEQYMKINAAMTEKIKQLGRQMQIEFLTESAYQR